MANPLDEHYLSNVTLVSNVESPCVRNCCLDDADICVGCGRTLSEILAWGQASTEEKSQILQRIKDCGRNNVFDNE